MKKTLLTVVALFFLNTGIAIAQPSTTEVGIEDVPPHMVAESNARKGYCRTLRRQKKLYTVRDYRTCVKGNTGRHPEYAVGVVYPEKKDKDSK